MIFTDSIYPRTNANHIKQRLYFLWHFKFKYLDFHEKCVLAHEKDPVYRMILQIFLEGSSEEKVVQKHTGCLREELTLLLNSYVTKVLTPCTPPPLQ